MTDPRLLPKGIPRQEGLQDNRKVLQQFSFIKLISSGSIKLFDLLYKKYNCNKRIKKQDIMIKEKIPAIEKLSREEKLRLAGELWGEVFAESDVELTEEQKRELDRRIKYADQHPEDMIPWDQVREELRKGNDDS